MPDAEPVALTRRRAGAVLLGAALAAQLVAAAGAVAGPWAITPQPIEVTRAAAAPAPVATAARPAPTTAAAAAGPVRLAVPALWSGELQAGSLSLDDRGALEVPATAGELGWWADGPRPGDVGAAVVVGHVDLDGRPGVFARLASVRPGDVVVADGVAFTVTAVDRYAKRGFPTDEVYQPSERRELRLITCGGRFDRRTGHYEDNVVVRAVQS